jgi:hypothetical protein
MGQLMLMDFKNRLKCFENNVSQKDGIRNFVGFAECLNFFVPVNNCLQG